jgi:tetraprenyl-beta-curcumene synthase
MRPAALTHALSRELLWGLRHVSREVGKWRVRAATIPDPELRADALNALANKRGNINGAAMFWTLPDRRDHNLLKALIAYEVLADYLDCVSERGASLGLSNGRQLHVALVEALDPLAPISDYYRHHNHHEDGGYASALVRSCRASCAELPSFAEVQPFLARAGGLSQVLALNHEPHPAARAHQLKEWADLNCSAQAGLDNKWQTPTGQTWFERAAGASAWLTVFAMLALATEQPSAERAPHEVQHTYESYLRWIAPIGAMLDSYGDLGQDLASAQHSYISHYPDMEIAVERLGALIHHSRRTSAALPRGARHSLIAACMVAFYLSKDSVSTPTMSASTRKLQRAGGPLAVALTPVLRLWRIRYGQRSA